MIFAIAGAMLFTYGSVMISMDMLAAIRDGEPAKDVIVLGIESAACAAVAALCTLPIHP